MAILGVAVRVEKDVRPVAETDVLGLRVRVSPSPTTIGLGDPRRSALMAKLAAALDDDRLTPTGAGSLAGKLAIACCGIFGKVGRAYLHPLYRQQHGSSQSLGRRLRRALQ